MPAPVIHFEIGCKNNAKTSKFYGDLFGWTFDAYGPASMINNLKDRGISGHINTLGHEPHNYITIYAQVDNLQATLDKATKLGAQTLVTPTEVPGMGHFAWFKDPEGTIMGIWKPIAM